MKLNLEIDYEAADRIAVAVLTQYRDSLQESLQSHEDGGWMHKDDVSHAKEMIVAINFVLKDFTVQE